jgi:hypothetical protein
MVLTVTPSAGGAGGFKHKASRIGKPLTRGGMTS